MAKFLNTHETYPSLEKLIQNTKEHLILISPCFELNNHIKELLADKNRSKIEMYIIYSRSELHPDDIKWVLTLDYIHLGYYKNLHARCSINENECIISSTSLFDFNQINHGMGVLIHKQEDQKAFQDAYTEVQRIIQLSNPLNSIKISDSVITEYKTQDSQNISKITTSKLAAKYCLKTSNVLEVFADRGLITLTESHKYHLTDLGKSYGGEFKSSQYGGYFIWPEDISL